MNIKSLIIPKELAEKIIQEKFETHQSVPSIIIYALKFYFEAGEKNSPYKNFKKQKEKKQ